MKPYVENSLEIVFETIEHLLYYTNMMFNAWTPTWFAADDILKI